MTRLKGIVDLIKPITKEEAYSFYKKKEEELKQKEKEKKKNEKRQK